LLGGTAGRGLNVDVATCVKGETVLANDAAADDVDG